MNNSYVPIMVRFPGTGEAVGTIALPASAVAYTTLQQGDRVNILCVLYWTDDKDPFDALARAKALGINLQWIELPRLRLGPHMVSKADRPFYSTAVTVSDGNAVVDLHDNDGLRELYTKMSDGPAINPPQEALLSVDEARAIAERFTKAVKQLAKP